LECVGGAEVTAQAVRVVVENVTWSEGENRVGEWSISDTSSTSSVWDRQSRRYVEASDVVEFCAIASKAICSVKERGLGE